MNIRNIQRLYSGTIIVYAMVFVLFVAVLFMLSTFLQTNAKISDANTNIAQLEKKASLDSVQRSMTESDVDTFTKMLLRLVPEQEDYFSILYALEKISQDTGFKIVRYTVNVATSTPQKLSLIVEGDGDANSFLDFLEKYQFDGGRLITNEKIEFSAQSVGQIKLSLNFYNKKTTNESAAALNQSDITLLNTIKDKVQFDLSGNNTPIATDEYKVKSNPF